jgi:hypothetical protein
MSSLDPQPRARSASDSGQAGAFRQSQPGVLSERLASFFKASLKHESFKTARNVEQDACVCVPFLEAHLFPTIVKKGDEPHTLSSRRPTPEAATLIRSSPAWRILKTQQSQQATQGGGISPRAGDAVREQHPPTAAISETMQGGAESPQDGLDSLTQPKTPAMGDTVATAIWVSVTSWH